MQFLLQGSSLNRFTFVCDVASMVYRSHGHTAGSPYCCKHYWTVYASTCCLANDIISWLRSHGAAVQSIKCMRVRCVSCHLLVIAGSWDLAFCSVWTFRNHLLHILQTAIGYRPTRAAILPIHIFKSICNNTGISFKTWSPTAKCFH